MRATDPEFDKFIRAAAGRRRKPDGNEISSSTVESFSNYRKILYWG
jgi:hypothetical protein